MLQTVLLDLASYQPKQPSAKQFLVRILTAPISLMSSCLGRGFQAALRVQLSKLWCGHVQVAKTHPAWGLQDWPLHVCSIVRDDEKLVHGWIFLNIT